MSTSWLMRLTAPATMGLTIVNELFELPMKRWSYSTPNDQFGVKPYSNPTPRAPPQRVELADATVAQQAVVTMSKRLSVTAAPPLTYSSAAFQAQPICPVKRPRLSTLTCVEKAGLIRLMREALMSAQSPWASRPNTNPPVCQR